MNIEQMLQQTNALEQSRVSWASTRQRLRRVLQHCFRRFFRLPETRPHRLLHLKVHSQGSVGSAACSAQLADSAVVGFLTT